MMIFTADAVSHIRDNMAKEAGAVGFFLAVKKTGCSGYAWKPKIISAIPEQALHFVTPEGLAVYIDDSAKPFVEGITVDFAEDKSALKQKKLVFINPNETGRCGCGESFTVE